MVTSLTDILSQVLGWLSIICVVGLAVLFSLFVLFSDSKTKMLYMVRRYSSSSLECPLL